MKRVALRQPAHRQPGGRPEPVPLEGQARVLGARGREAAGRGQKRRDPALVPGEEGDRQGSRSEMASAVRDHPGFRGRSPSRSRLISVAQGPASRADVRAGGASRGSRCSRRAAAGSRRCRAGAARHGDPTDDTPPGSDGAADCARRRCRACASPSRRDEVDRADLRARAASRPVRSPPGRGDSRRGTRCAGTGGPPAAVVRNLAVPRWSRGHTARRLRPLRRRRESTARPCRVRIRTRKPWVFLRRRLFG